MTDALAVEVVTEADFDRDDTYETALTRYVSQRAGTMAIKRGIGPNGAAVPGTLQLNVDNINGVFTPEYASSSLYGLLEPSVPIRVRCVHNSIDYVIYTGYTVKYAHTFGAPGESRAQIEGRDLAHYLEESDLVNVTVSASRDTDAALVAIMDALGLSSADRDFDDGVQDLPLHYCLAQSGWAAMNDVVRSEMGPAYLFVNAAGQVAFHARNTRLGVGSPAHTWGNGTDIHPESIGYTVRDDDYVTSVRARATVFRTGQADVEIFRFSRSMNNETPDSLALAAGEIYERDFDTQSAVVSITAPVSGTDYLANTAVDGSGTDKTSALTVAVVDRGAGRFNLKLTNTDASTVYVTLFRLRGQPTNFFADRPEAFFSLSVPGRKAGKVVSLDVPFGGDGGQTLRDHAYSTLRTYRYIYPIVKLTFAWATDAIIVAMLSADLGDQVWFDDTGPGGAQWLTNVKDWWYIEGLEHQILPGSIAKTTVTLTPSYLCRNLDAIAFDTFARADASGGLGESYSGDTWANDSGFDIASNLAVANTDTLSIPDLTLGVNDQIWEVQLAAIGTGDEVGLNVRKTDANNYLRAYVDKGSNEVILEEVVAGVATELASPAFTVGSAHEMRVMVQGTRVRVWVDRLKHIDATTSITTGTKGGLFARSASGTTTFGAVYGQGL